VLYINGVSTGTYTGAITQSVNPICIGTTYTASNANQYFKGSVDQPRVFNRALTLTEVQTLYTNLA